LKKHLFLLIFVLILIGFTACDRLIPINQPVEIAVEPTITPGSLFAPFDPTDSPSSTAESIPETEVVATSEISSPEKFEVSEGDWLIYTGEYAKAMDYFTTIFNDPNSTKNDKAEALLGLGRIEYLENRYGASIEYFDALIAEYPLTEPAKRANFFLAEIYTVLNDSDTAIRAYSNFSEAYPGIIDDQIMEKIGDAYSALGNYSQAVDAYEAAQQASQDEYQIDELRIKIAQSYYNLGESDIAIQIYLDTYSNTQSAAINAKINLLLGRLYQELGQNEAAFERYQENLTYWPYLYDTYTSLVILIENEQEVDEYQRGLTDYYAGLYGLAADAFNRYIEATPANERNGDVHFYNGLCYIYLEQYQNAIAQWQILVNEFESSQFWSNGTDEIAYTYWLYLDDAETGTQIYLDFVANFPYHEDSPNFLYWAARMYERENELALAAQTWERMLLEYPAYPDVFRAQQLAGISYYRLNEYEQAMQTFNTMLQYADTPEDQSAAHFWLGKTQQAIGETNQAIASWENAYRTNANGYYGIRANQLLNAESPFLNDPYFIPMIDLGTEREQAGIWLLSTFGIGDNVDLSADAAYLNNPTAIRGDLFWAIGLYNESLYTYERLREDTLNDPLNTFRLLERLTELGHYREAAFAARHIIDLANLGSDDYLLPPRYFNHLRFATHFESLVTTAALKYAIPSQVIFSQIRQESLFDSRIGSSAGAMGLMQIIPATGDFINNQIQWDVTYQTNDLLLPQTNIEMGSYYIDLQRDYFDGQWIPALAAYNAGPGNAQIWLELARGDIDLFVEIIRFEETRNYILHIAETYHAYSILYSITSE
jgi:soluble lytic murein transglycosylase